MAGKRAPELACGKIFSVLDDITAATEVDLCAHVDEVLGNDTRTKLLNDWSSAREHIKFVLSVKLQFTQCIPWMLAGIAHHDETQAQQCARESVSQLDANHVEPTTMCPYGFSPAAQSCGG